MSYCISIAKQIREIAIAVSRAERGIWRVDLEEVSKGLNLAASYAEKCDFANARIHFEKSYNLAREIRRSLKEGEKSLELLELEMASALRRLISEIDKFVDEMEGILNLIKLLAPG